MKRGVYVAQGVFAGIMFGTASIFIRFLPSMDAFSIGFYRLIIAVAMMTPVNILLFRNMDVRAYLGKLKMLILLGLLIGFHFIFFISAVKNTTILNTTVLVNTTPAITLLLAWIFLRDRPARHRVVGLFLTLAGASSIAMLETTYSPGNLVGDAQAFLAALFWSVYLILGKPVREGGNVLILMPPIYLVACLPLLTSGYVIQGGLAIPTGDEIVFLLCLAFFPTVLGHTLHFSSLKALSAFQTSILALLEPIVASILAALILFEVPNPLFYLGASITLFGIYLVLR